MSFDDKYKKQIIENHRIYAHNNTAHIEKDIMNKRIELMKSAKELYRDPSVVTEVFGKIEGKERGDHIAEYYAKMIEEDPEKLGKTNERLLSSKETRNNLKETAAELAGGIRKLGDLEYANKNYIDHWKMANAAYKAPSKELDAKVEDLKNQRDFSDTVRDTRIKDRTWTPHENQYRHMDKGLQRGPDALTREQEKERGDTDDPFSL